MTLDDRKFRILQAIIDDYILTAMPVGSRTISRKYGMGLSSATIRNEMSDLEELGYLDQPHTSAGRVPSWRAYRWYVDQIMLVSGLSPEDNAHLKGVFNHRMRQMEDVIRTAAQAIAELTDYTAVVLPPQLSSQRLKRVQLVRVSEDRALLVLVTDLGMTQETMVTIPPDWSDDHLYMLSTLITAHVDGRTSGQLEDAVAAIATQMSDQKELFHSILGALTKSIHAARKDVVLGGASKLLQHPEYADIEKARTVLNALETRDQLTDMLIGRSGTELSISIGPEISIPGMEDCSLVTVSYRLGGDKNGAMGVIGPARMHYGRVLSVLKGMKAVINQVFHNEEDER